MMSMCRVPDEGTFDTRLYMDGLGRELASFEEGEVEFVVSNAVRFNRRGNRRDALQPYRAASDDFATVPFDRTVLTFDALGREVLLTPPHSIEATGSPMSDHQAKRNPS